MSINKREISSIHYMRGIAASFIVFFHILNRKNIYNTSYIDWLNSGVDIFFVISGFVIFSVAINPNMTPREFLRRRFIRVVPLYWFFTSIFILLSLYIPNFNSSSIFHTSQAIKSFLFIPHYHATHSKEIWPLLIAGWSLNYEIFFYIIFAGVLLTGKKFLFTKITILFSSFVIMKSFIKIENPIFIAYTNPILMEFIAGVLFAKLYYRTILIKKLEKIKYFGILILLISFLLLIISIHPSISVLPRVIKWGIPASLIILSCLLSEEYISKFKVIFLRILGNASYSIYLSHPFSIGACSFFWKKINYSFHGTSLFIFTLFSFSICIIIGILSYYIIEKPLLNFLQKWIKKEVQNIPQKQIMITKYTK